MTYTASQAQAGRGSQITVGSSPIHVGEVKEIQLNRGKWQTVSVTNFDSALEEELIQTIRKAGTVALKGNRVASDAGQAAVEAAYQAGGATPFAITLPKSATQTVKGDSFAFNALVVGSDFTLQVEQAIEFSIELQITGGAPETPGS